MSNTVDAVVTLILPVSKVNTIIAGLAELPFKQSSEVIATVQQQAEADLKRQKEFMKDATQQPIPIPIPVDDPQ